MEGNNQELIRELSFPLFNAKGWMKLLGILAIIYGVLMIFTIWGIIICWLPIWMGVLLFRAGNSIERARMSGEQSDLNYTLNSLKTFFTIQGVLALIGLIAVGIGLVIAGGALFTLLSSS